MQRLPEQSAVLDRPDIAQLNHASAEAEPTFRQRFASSRLGRVVLGGLVALGLTGPAVAAATPAHAESGHVYTVENTGGDGVWLHSDPGLGDKGDLIKKMPDGTRFDAECYVNDTPIGDRNNPVWLYGTDDTGARGYFTDVYSSSRWNRNNTLQDQGLPICGENTQQEEPSTDPNPQRAGSVPVFASFDGSDAAAWALDHARDTPPNAGSCTWFVTKAWIAGGLQETSEWNDDFHGLNRDILRYGTDTAWVTPKFVGHFSVAPFVEVIPLGKMNENNNNVPDAELGDAIIYDWNNDGSPDHASIVVGFAKNNQQYPLVSGWSENGSEASTYRSRGWTWSEKGNDWLQNRPGNQNTTATLLHIRTEEEALR